MIKKCTKCGENKSLDMFYRAKDQSSGLRPECKVCQKGKNKEWATKNKDKIKSYLKEYNVMYQKTEKRKEYLKKYRSREDVKLRCNEKQKIRSQMPKTKERIKKYSKEYYKRPEVIAGRKEYMRTYMRDYEKQRKLRDPQYKISRQIRHRIYIALKGNKKRLSSIEELGCTIPELKDYITGKFQVDMTWDNYCYTGWHLDHIVPLSSFDLTDPEDFKRACHYTNLQPLWAKDNISKGNKIKTLDF